MDLEARTGAYLCIGKEEDVRRHAEQLCRKDSDFARLGAQVKEGESGYARTCTVLTL